jgi:predicted  nucleic acid-binding Zn-ribbon protein
VKHLSFRILFLCVFLPPVLYIFSIQGLETYFQSTWKSGLRDELVSNVEGLMAGEARLHEVVRGNVKEYFRGRWPLKLGADPRVVVRTKEGRLIYPVLGYEESALTNRDLSLRGFLSGDEKSRIAERNMEILREGLVLRLSVQVPRNTWLANIVLVVYILIFSSILFFSYRYRARQAEEVTRKQREELEDAQRRLQQAQSRLQEVSGKEDRYQQEIDRLRGELQKADSRIQATEQEAMEELEDLEKKLQESVEQREKKEEEIQTLLQEVEQLESKRKGSSRKKDKEFQQIRKRFQTLYKQLSLHDRAVEGFLELPQDMHLKAEEVLHTLNEDSGKVQVKRKVFFKKSSLTAFETVFAYKGRLYWRKNENGGIEVLAIGTKNTQNRDLNYLEGLSGD